jgi:hypothetical protein
MHAAPAAVKEDNLEAATALVAYLAALRIHPILEDSNGNVGYDVVAILAQSIPSQIAFAFACEAVREAGLHEGTEMLPAQASAHDKFDNAYSLFGRHQDWRPHLSRFLHAGQWLEGTEAVEYLLHAPINDPSPVFSRIEQAGSAIVPSIIARGNSPRAAILEGRPQQRAHLHCGLPPFPTDGPDGAGKSVECDQRARDASVGSCLPHGSRHSLISTAWRVAPAVTRQAASDRPPGSTRPCR